MLFRNTTELQLYAQIENTNFASVSSTIKHIENNVLAKIIGVDLYDDLEQKYQNNSLDSDYTKLLDKCRLVIGPLFTHSFIVTSSIILGDNGAQRIETTTNKTAFNYQVRDSRQEWKLQAETEIENLLSFLYSNSEKFEKFLESTTYKESQKLLIKNATDFDLQFTTPQPYRFYNAVLFKMKDVELLEINAIPLSVYKSLKNKKDYEEEESVLVSLLKKAVAYLTIASAIPYLNIRFDDNGITIVSDYGSIDSKETQPRKAADDTKVSQLIKQAKADGTAFLSKASDYYKANYNKIEGAPEPEKKVVRKSNYGCNNERGVVGL